MAAASGHIDALAKTVKRAGDSRPIDHIRADLFLGMTDGTYAGLSDVEILELLTSTAVPGTDQPDPHSPDGNDGGDSNDCESDPHGPEDGGCDDDEAGDGGSPPVSRPSRSDRVAVGAGLELRVRLSTLLGRDQYPAELAGWGPVHAELARNLAATLGGAPWRFAITGNDGQLTHCGVTRARPTGFLTRSATCRAIVEIQVTATTLRALDGDPTALGGWASVIADLTRHLDNDSSGENEYCADATRRTPGAALRRYLAIRDRYCVMIGCRAPAHTADKDHTVDHANSGPTIGPNLGDACRHDHRLKG